MLPRARRCAARPERIRRRVKSLKLYSLLKSYIVTRNINRGRAFSSVGSTLADWLYSVRSSKAISSCEKAARWQHAAVLLQEMLASRVDANVVCRLPGTGHDVIIGRTSERCQGYNAAISAFGAGGRWELSLQHCRELLAASLFPGLNL